MIVGQLRQLLLSGVTQGTSAPVNAVGYPTFVVFFSSVGTTSGGALVIEEADWRDDPPDAEQIYTSTWSTIATVNANTFTGGAQVAVHGQYTGYAFLRVRVSSPITGGGTVSAAIRLAA
jgi:hypothetical protein